VVSWMGAPAQEGNSSDLANSLHVPIEPDCIREIDTKSWVFF
jgi:hypothetical protein